MTDPLHHPNLKPDDKESGLICFKDKDRECGASCMAYTDVPEGPDYVGKQWANCMLLVNSHRTGKHLTIIANIGDKLLKKMGTSVNQTPPPSPLSRA